MSPDELAYYRERAAAERQLASQSANPVVAEIHGRLAELYQQLVDLDRKPRAKLHLVEVMNPAR